MRRMRQDRSGEVEEGRGCSERTIVRRERYEHHHSDMTSMQKNNCNGCGQDVHAKTSCWRVMPTEQTKRWRMREREREKDRREKRVPSVSHTQCVLVSVRVFVKSHLNKLIHGKPDALCDRLQAEKNIHTATVTVRVLAIDAQESKRGHREPTFTFKRHTRALSHTFIHAMNASTASGHGHKPPRSPHPCTCCS